MTVNVQYEPLQYACNGVTVEFPITWPFLADAQIRVKLVAASGAETPLTSNGIDYTLDRNPDGQGGMVTVNTAPASGVMLFIERTTPRTQPDTLRLGGTFDPRTIEQMIDRAVMIDQEQERPVAGAPGSPIVVGADGKTLAVGDAEITGDMLLRPELAQSAPGKGAAMLGWAQGGADALAQSVLDELRRVLRPEHYGADPTGVSECNTAFSRAFADATARGGYVVEGLPGATYLLTQGLNIPSGSGLVCKGWMTLKCKTGLGGFNVTDLAGDRLSVDRCVIPLSGKDDIVLDGIVIEPDSTKEIVTYGVRVAGGFGSPSNGLRIGRMKFRNMKAGGGVSINSIGAGSYHIDYLWAEDCGTSKGTSYWTGGYQFTVFETDNDLVGGAHSVAGVVNFVGGRNVLLTGTALANYGQQTDIVNVAGVSNGTDRKGPTILAIYADGVGEALDAFGSVGSYRVTYARNVEYDVVKLAHGAQHSDVEVCVVDSCGRSVVVLSSSTATNGATSAKVQRNNIRIGTARGIGTVGIGLTGTSAVVYLGGGQSPATAWPVENMVTIDLLVADANLDYIVYDENSGDVGAANEVHLRKMIGSPAIRSIGGASAGAGTQAFENNCRLRYAAKSHVRAGRITSGQTITTDTPLVWNNEARDTLGEYDTATGKFTAKWPGFYRINATPRVGGLALGDDILLQIMQGASSLSRTFDEHYGSTAEGSFFIDDTVEVRAEHIGTANAEITVRATATGAGPFAMTAVNDMSFLRIDGQD